MDQIGSVPSLALGVLDVKTFKEQRSSAYSAETTRLGLVVYGSEVDFKLDFSPRLSAKELNDTVLGIEYPDSETYTNKGISAALSIFEKGERRSGTARIMAVFTDGKSDDGVLAVNDVSQQKITTFAVGIGSVPTKSELLQIAGKDSSHVFNVDDYTALYESVTAIVSDICRQPVRLYENERVDDAVGENERRNYQISPQSGSRDLIIFFQNKVGGHTKAYFSCTPGVSDVYNEGQLQEGYNVFPLPFCKLSDSRSSSRKRRNAEDPDDDDYYWTEGEKTDGDDDRSRTEEPAEEEERLYIVVVSLEPVQSIYSIMAINDTDSISDLNVTRHVHTKSRPIAPSSTMSKPNSKINSETGNTFSSVEISLIILAVISGLIIIIACFIYQKVAKQRGEK